MEGAGAEEAYMQLQVLVEEMGLREAPPLLPVLGAEGVVEAVRGYAGRLCGGGRGEGEVDVRRDLLRLGTCTFVFCSFFFSCPPF